VGKRIPGALEDDHAFDGVLRHISSRSLPSSIDPGSHARASGERNRG
jgi:hypothetical protein